MRVLDLFSGIGGFSLGLERAGMETVAFCEIEPFCQKVLKKHWPDVPCYDDVTELTIERLKTDGITEIEVITAGFPCQDVSVSGKGAGIDGIKTGLWSECRRLIGEIRPEYALMENVSNLLVGDSGRWFGRVLGELAEIGYDAEWHCIPASYVGSWHRRDRVWILAYPNSECVQGSNKKPILQQSSLQVKPARVFEGWTGRRGVPKPRTCGGDVRIRERIHAIGNSLVPQIPEIIGYAIMDHKTVSTVMDMGLWHD